MFIDKISTGLAITALLRGTAYQCQNPKAFGRRCQDRRATVLQFHGRERSTEVAGRLTSNILPCWWNLTRSNSKLLALFIPSKSCSDVQPFCIWPSQSYLWKTPFPLQWESRSKLSGKITSTLQSWHRLSHSLYTQLGKGSTKSAFQICRRSAQKNGSTSSHCGRLSYKAFSNSIHWKNRHDRFPYLYDRLSRLSILQIHSLYYML